MSDSNEYVAIPIKVQAFQFQLGMEDKMPSRSVNTRGRPQISTPNGDQYVFEGSEDTPADWVIIFPDATKEVMSDKLFHTRFKLPTTRKKRKTTKTK